MSRDWLEILGWALFGALIGALIGAGSLTVTGVFSVKAVLIGIGAGAFIGLAYGILRSATRCARACRIG